MDDVVVTRRKVLVTGAQGFVGRSFVAAAAEDPSLEVVATDVVAPETPPAGVAFRRLDVCDGEAVRALFVEIRPDVVVHLAAVVTPRPGQSREDQRRVDVDGTRNVLAACADAGTRKIVVTSSGAAYGYHADNPALITEDAPLRGNEVFAYAWHKKLVEDLLAEYRAAHPSLGQLVFRVSTVLGPRVKNQITALFEGPVVVGLRGVDTPFCFVSDEDVVRCLLGGVRDAAAVGTYNLAGEGAMTLREIAAALHKPFVPVPKRLMTRGLSALSRRGLVPYGPEQVLFLAHRPVLSNRALVERFGFRPTPSREVFAAYVRSRTLA